LSEVYDEDDGADDGLWEVYDDDDGADDGLWEVYDDDGYGYGNDGADDIACQKEQAGLCININFRRCAGAQLKTGFCPGDQSVQCCPPPGQPASLSENFFAGDDGYGYGYDAGYDDANGVEGSLGSCIGGQSGVCINTFTFDCGSSATLTGFCEGANHVRCCPSSDPEPKLVSDGAGADGYGGHGSGATGYGGDDFDNGGGWADDGGYGDDDQLALGLGACNVMDGVCIDVTRTDCIGQPALGGFCGGKNHIRCCPAPASIAKLQQTSAVGAACLQGSAGVCIDIRTNNCLGAVVLVGICAGDASVRCCPEPGRPEYPHMHVVGGSGGVGQGSGFGDDLTDSANGGGGSGTDVFAGVEVTLSCTSTETGLAGQQQYRTDMTLGLSPPLRHNVEGAAAAAWAPASCHMSRTSIQPGWTACVCDTGGCSGSGCNVNAAVAFWEQGECPDCVCDDAALTSSGSSSDTGASAPTRGDSWSSNSTALVVIMLLLVCCIAVLGGVAWRRKQLQLEQNSSVVQGPAAAANVVFNPAAAPRSAANAEAVAGETWFGSLTYDVGYQPSTIVSADLPGLAGSISYNIPLVQDLPPSYRSLAGQNRVPHNIPLTDEGEAAAVVVQGGLTHATPTATLPYTELDSCGKVYQIPLEVVGEDYV
jgi:hypothetical protein